MSIAIGYKQLKNNCCETVMMILSAAPVLYRLLFSHSLSEKNETVNSIHYHGLVEVFRTFSTKTDKFVLNRLHCHN
jgi:hypothetical protein